MFPFALSSIVSIRVSCQVDVSPLPAANCFCECGRTTSVGGHLEEPKSPIEKSMIMFKNSISVKAQREEIKNPVTHTLVPFV